MERHNVRYASRGSTVAPPRWGQRNATVAAEADANPSSYALSEYLHPTGQEGVTLPRHGEANRQLTGHIEFVHPTGPGSVGSPSLWTAKEVSSGSLYCRSRQALLWPAGEARFELLLSAAFGGEMPTE